LAKNCPTPVSFGESASSLPMFPLEFRGEVNHEETRFMGLSYNEDRMHDCSMSRFDTVPACDK